MTSSLFDTPAFLQHPSPHIYSWERVDTRCITRNMANSGWVLKVGSEGEHFHAFFSDRIYSGREPARQAAIETRNIWYEELGRSVEPPDVTKREFRPEGRWKEYKFQYPPGSRRKASYHIILVTRWWFGFGYKRSFSVLYYGREAAIQLAEQTLAEWQENTDRGEPPFYHPKADYPGRYRKAS